MRLQTPEDGQSKEDFVAQVVKILYATEDDFVSPEDLEKENGAEAEAPAAEAVEGAAAVETY